MSTLINLLPDLRQAKLREHHRRQLATGISVAIWVVCGGVVALLAVYMGGQKAVIAGYTRSITDKEQKLQAVPDLLDALTAEQHLAALPDLYSQRVHLSKLLDVYSQATPVGVALTSMAVDPQNVLTIRGVANSYSDVAKTARGLLASNVTVGTGANATNTPYFTNVEISSTALDDTKGVDFSITATVATGAVSGSN